VNVLPPRLVQSPFIFGAALALAAGFGAALPAAAPATPATAPATKPWTPPVFADRQDDRDAMVKLIKDYYGMSDAPTLAALASVPRHEYVPDSLQAQAYDDSPLPIANGQLISQPCIVGEMTRQLQLKPNAKVLEIGTGSGYQASVLTCLTPRVYTIEIIKPLAEAAAVRLKRLGYTTVHTRIADGFIGWAEEAPFDAIIVTCAAGQIPPPLLKQLAPGGRMMIPVGDAFAMQSLMLVQKDKDGIISSKSLQPVRFVPLLQKDPTADAK
jgi:protein-L-isoaspartate(D-aspartate) O-methyltransferase